MIQFRLILFLLKIKIPIPNAPATAWVETYCQPVSEKGCIYAEVKERPSSLKSQETLLLSNKTTVWREFH